MGKYASENSHGETWWTDDCQVMGCLLDENSRNLHISCVMSTYGLRF